MATQFIDPRKAKPLSQRETGESLEFLKYGGGGGGVDLPINISDVTDLPSELAGKASTESLTSGLAGKANTVHTHTIAQVTSLQAVLDTKGTSNLAIGTTSTTAMAGNTPIPTLPITIGDVTGLQVAIDGVIPSPPISGVFYLQSDGGVLSWVEIDVDTP